MISSFPFAIGSSVTRSNDASMVSFLEGNPKPDRKITRIKRGLYVSKNGIHIHADVNGAYNIMRKVCSDAFTKKDVPVKLYLRRIDVSINEIRKKSPDIFGWNGVGARHHPKPVYTPVLI